MFPERSCRFGDGCGVAPESSLSTSPCPQEVTHPIKDTSKRALMDGLVVTGGSMVIAIRSIPAQEETHGMDDL